MVAAQDFRHAIQREDETVADYIRRMERCFQVAYGRDNLSQETRDTMLFGQLQEGLRYNIVKNPSVSGSQSYKELCMAAKNEEKRMAELHRRQQYQNPTPRRLSDKRVPTLNKQPVKEGKSHQPNPVSSRLRQCYNCGSTEHLVKNCKAPKQESTSRSSKNKNPPVTKMVSFQPAVTEDMSELTPYLMSDSDEGEKEVRTIRVKDTGSQHQRAAVDIQGVPAEGIIDSWADISIIGAELFKKIAAVARLKKSQLKKVDKVPVTYDQKPLKLDGRLDLDITFQGQTMCTPVYVKMDAHDPLLLSEGVCRQLQIITYHPSIETQLSEKKATPEVTTVCVRLVGSARLPPQQTTLVSVQVEGHCSPENPMLVEPAMSFSDGEGEGLYFSDSLVTVSTDGCAQLLLTNPTGFTRKLDGGIQIGSATEAVRVEPEVPGDNGIPVSDIEPELGKSLRGGEGEDSDVGVFAMATDDSDNSDRKRRLAHALAEVGPTLTWQQKDSLCQLLLAQHQGFALDEGERGNTDVIQMSIDTGDATPRRLPLRRTPFAVRVEVAEQLRKMQAEGVIRPSSSPWASPVVLVRKKDGSLRFCIDYRSLNAVTKTDQFPLPRIDDLLDQLGKAKYFSTLDLAAGYWQVQMHPDSVEKTAFATYQGLYEFTVMPFGLKNAPGVFQRLMQRVLMGLNPEEGPDFVSVYLDDLLVFSETIWSTFAEYWNN